jgi:transposase
MRPSGKPVLLQERRSQAIRLLQKGHRPVDVARMLGVDRRSVRRWKSAYGKRGERGITAQPNTGRPPRLNEVKVARLERLLLKGAQAAGFPTDLWTCPRIALLIEKRFNVTYHVDHISRLMRSLGWSPQRPQRRPLERDEVRVHTWHRVQWPRIKKKPVS